MGWGLTSDGAEGVEVLGGEQRGRKLPDELLEEGGGVVGADLVPDHAPGVEGGLQGLLQQLGGGANTMRAVSTTAGATLFVSTLKGHCVVSTPI